MLQDSSSGNQVFEFDDKATKLYDVFVPNRMSDMALGTGSGSCGGLVFPDQQILSKKCLQNIFNYGILHCLEFIGLTEGLSPVLTTATC